MHEFLQHWSEWVLTGGYLAIIVLMAVGSTPIPLPAEMVVPPVAFLAADKQGNLTVTKVILASTLGAYLGAAVMYWLSLWLGRPLVVKFGDSFYSRRKNSRKPSTGWRAMKPEASFFRDYCRVFDI